MKRITEFFEGAKKCLAFPSRGNICPSIKEKAYHQLGKDGECIYVTRKCTIID